MFDFTKYNDMDMIYIVDTFLYNNDDECKRLLGLFLGTENQDVVERYYDKLQELREREYFDPEKFSLGLTWHWGAFFSGFLFYWYRRQYGMMPIVFLLMFIGLLPSLMTSAACAYSRVLNSFYSTIIKGLENKEFQKNFKKIVNNDIGDSSAFERKLIEISSAKDDLGEDEVVCEIICDTAMPYIEAELEKRGGVDNRAIVFVVLLFIIACIIVVANI